MRAAGESSSWRQVGCEAIVILIVGLINLVRAIPHQDAT